MTEDNRRAAIANELDDGAQALDAARALRELGLHRDALSRLYYALFHHAVALLLMEGIEPRRHRALPTLLSTHLEPRGTVTAEDVALVGRIGSYRDLADYARGWKPTRTIVDQAISDVEEFVDRAVAALRDGGWISPQR